MSTSLVDSRSVVGVDDFSEFLEELREALDGRGFLVIIDEFDELPNTAFDRGGPGDPLFRALKAQSSEGDCGFFLVGGERLELAIARQSDRLNAFREHRVHYIGADQIEDFVELVRRPVESFLRIDDEAIVWLHERTAGHPFYTLLVCRQVVTGALNARDGHVTVFEMQQAYHAALESAPATAFAHIWFDYVFADEASVHAIAERRLQVLLSWASILRSGGRLTLEGLMAEAAGYRLDAASVQEVVREFVARGLVTQSDNDRLEPVSPFFGDWLREWGPERIRLDAPSMDAIAPLKAADDVLRVSAAEVRELRDKWPLYQSRPVEAEDVRAWLDQFPGVRDQRLSFTVLQALRFVSNVELRELFGACHVHVRRGTRIAVDVHKFQREFLVVYVENDGKSASLMAKQYAHANRIHNSCVSSASRLQTMLEKDSYERVVIVDDFVGTGGTAVSRMTEYRDVLVQAAEHTGRPVVFAPAVAFRSGEQRVLEWVEAGGMPVEVAVGEVMMETDSCFAEGSEVFQSAEDRLLARRLFEDTARRLGSTEPLGTGGLEGLIVFEHNCPNNTLPLIWKRTDSWDPLFERLRAGG
jgi:hypothetical protein